MAVPTISTISPAVGPTRGLSLVEIVGTGFRLPTLPPPASGPSGPAVPTVEVEFGDLSPEVRVLTDTLLQCVTPGSARGAVDVVLRNLDDNGDPIVGEEVTEAGGFTFKRPNLAIETDLTRAVRAILELLRRDIIPEVVLTQHTEYDDATGDNLHLTAVPKLPAIILGGPTIPENRIFSLNGPQTLERNGKIFQVRQPRTVDLVFDLVVVADHPIEFLSLETLVEDFFNTHKTLAVDRDPADLPKGKVSYELEMTGDMVNAQVPNLSNLHSATTEFEIRGVDIQHIDGFLNDGDLRELFEGDTINVDAEAT